MINIVLLGMTGAGKSSTGNTILARNLFPVSGGLLSCTREVQKAIDFQNKLNVFDTPGFNDVLVNEEEVRKMIQTIAQSIFSQQENPKIDVFLIVIRYTDRFSTAKETLLKVIELFGNEALRSSIFLIINSSNQPVNKSLLFSCIEKMTQFIEPIKLSKPKNSILDDYFLIWNNLEPVPYQEQDLFKMIANIPPYFSQMFENFLKKCAEENFINIQTEKNLLCITYQDKLTQYNQKINHYFLKDFIKTENDFWEEVKVNIDKNSNIELLVNQLKSIKQNKIDDFYSNLNSSINLIKMQSQQNLDNQVNEITLQKKVEVSSKKNELLIQIEDTINARDIENEIIDAVQDECPTLSKWKIKNSPEFYNTVYKEKQNLEKNRKKAIKEIDNKCEDILQKALMQLKLNAEKKKQENLITIENAKNQATKIFFQDLNEKFKKAEDIIEKYANDKQKLLNLWETKIEKPNNEKACDICKTPLDICYLSRPGRINHFHLKCYKRFQESIKFAYATKCQVCRELLFLPLEFSEDIQGDLVIIHHNFCKDFINKQIFFSGIQCKKKHFYFAISKHGFNYSCSFCKKMCLSNIPALCCFHCKEYKCTSCIKNERKSLVINGDTYTFDLIPDVMYENPIMVKCKICKTIFSPGIGFFEKDSISYCCSCIDKLSLGENPIWNYDESIFLNKNQSLIDNIKKDDM